jgi:hypothetical protein
MGTRASTLMIPPAMSQMIRRVRRLHARGGQEVVGPPPALKLSKLAGSTRGAARKWSGPVAGRPSGHRPRRRSAARSASGGHAASRSPRGASTPRWPALRAADSVGPRAFVCLAPDRQPPRPSGTDVGHGETKG